MAINTPDWLSLSKPCPAFAVLLGASLLLSACGLRPLYSGGAGGAVAQSLRSVEVAAIDGKAGWLMRHALEDRLGTPASGTARYRLEMAER